VSSALGAAEIIFPAKTRWITDGYSQTALVCEGEPKAWLFASAGSGSFQTCDVRIMDRAGSAQEACRQRLLGSHRAGSNVFFCDGSARLVRNTIDLEIYWSLVSRAGGEILDQVDL
jgi:prepilin-type processing-associated H-X9-DG protein